MTYLATMALLLAASGGDPQRGRSLLDTWIDPEDPSSSSAPAGASSSGLFAARYRFWQGEFSGNFRADDNNLQGTEVDVRKTLDIEEEENLSALSIWFGTSILGRVYLDYWDGTYEGDKILTEDVTYASTTFFTGENVHTKMEWKAITALYLYDITVPVVPGLSDLSLSVGIGLKFIRVHGKLSRPGFDESATARAPVPVVGGAATISVTEHFTAQIEASGFHVESWEGVATGSLWDVTAALRGHFAPAFVGVGYRWFGVRLQDERTDIDKVQADLLIEGAFVEVGVNF